MTDRLSDADVTRLLSDRSGEARADTAHKLAHQFSADALSARERDMAEEIFRIMVSDAEVRVREALSQQLKECGAVPRDVALALANDVDDVALPMLKSSSVLTDDDLIEIVRASGDANKQTAIAAREAVSELVSDALVETRSETVVATLMANAGAEISETSFEKAIETFAESARVHTPMVRRQKLPVRITERLVSVVSDSLRDHLMTHHEMAPEMAADLVLQSRERAIIGVSKGAEMADVQRLVKELNQNGRLTQSIVVRAGCMGDLAFMEAALAELTGIPLANAQKLIHDDGGLGLKSLYEHAKLPPDLYPALRVAIDVMHETHYDGNERDRERYRRRVLERILTQTEDVGDDNLDYLLDKLVQMGIPLDQPAAAH